MSTKLTLPHVGVEITVDTHELGEAMRQLKPWLLQARVASHPVTQPPVSPPPTATARASDDAIALGFLKMIADHDLSGGLVAEELLKPLGVTHAKGVGSRLTVVNKRLLELGFGQGDTYLNTERNKDGARVWRAGPRLRDAIERLQIFEDA